MNVEERLAAYAALIREWAPRLDLVSPADLDRLEERHIEDCLRAAPLLDGIPPGPCVDIGSGAGLPGIVLAIARPGRHWRLLEPRAKKAAFLEEVIRRLDLLGCEVVTERAQAAALDPALAAGHLIATARALAPPEAALRLALPLVAPDGVVVLWMGREGLLPEGAREWAPGIATMGASEGVDE